MATRKRKAPVEVTAPKATEPKKPKTIRKKKGAPKAADAIEDAGNDEVPAPKAARISADVGDANVMADGEDGKRPSRKAAKKVNTVVEEYGQLAHDPQNDGDITAPFWLGRFMEVETVPDELSASDLDNEIHPIFAKDKFSQVDYSVIETPARLATNLLFFGNLQPTIWTMLNKGEHELVYGAEPDKIGILRFGAFELRSVYYGYPVEDDVRDPESIDEAMAEEITDALLNLAGMVKFRRDDEVVGPGAVTVPCFALHLKSWYFDRGVGSTVRISDRLYQRLYDASTKYPEDLAELLTVQFQFAVMLVHELSMGSSWHLKPLRTTSLSSETPPWQRPASKVRFGYSVGILERSSPTLRTMILVDTAQIPMTKRAGAG